MTKQITALARRLIPRWLERYYDIDDAVQETLFEAWCDGLTEIKQVERCLRNNVKNAIRNTIRILQGRHKQRGATPWWLLDATGYQSPTLHRCSREPDPVFMAILKEQLRRLTTNQKSLLLGGKMVSKGAFHMAQMRAKKVLG